MAIITQAGLVRESLDDVIERLSAEIRTNISQNVSLLEQTPLGQIVRLQAQNIIRTQELLFYVQDNNELSTASGPYLAAIASLFGLSLNPATSTMINCVIRGDNMTQVPAGVRISSSEGIRFELVSTVTIGANGFENVTFRALNEGEVVVENNTVTEIVDYIDGWQSVTNTSTINQGKDAETESEYKIRHRLTVSRNESESLESIRSRLLEIPEVTAVLVRDNPTTSARVDQGVSIPAGHLLVVVQGGDNQAVAQAIDGARPPGIPLSGTRSVTIQHRHLGNIVIQFSPVTETALEAEINIRADVNFPTDGIAQITENLSDYVNGLSIAEPVNSFEFTSQIVDVHGHKIISAAYYLMGTTTVPPTPQLDQRYTLSMDNIRVSAAN